MIRIEERLVPGKRRGRPRRVIVVRVQRFERPKNGKSPTRRRIWNGEVLRLLQDAA